MFFYSLVIYFEKITPAGKKVDYNYVTIPFKDRVRGRNEVLLDYIQNYDVDEIITNVDISKFLKEYNIDHIKVTKK